MAFTAKDVQALREKTGVGMMDCKKALTETDGDMEKAIEFLRKKGLAAAEKKASRIAAEGMVYPYYDADKNVGVVVEVNAETDFVAKNDKFTSFVKAVANTVVTENPADLDALLACKLDGSDRTVQENLQDNILSIGENQKVRRFERVEGVCATYIHGGGSVGVLVNFDTNVAADNAEFVAMGKNIAMQIAAMNPEYLSKEDMSEAELENIKSITIDSSLNKPESLPKPILNKLFETAVNDKLFSDADIAAYEAEKNNKFLFNFLSKEAVATLAQLAVAGKEEYVNNKIFAGAVDGRIKKQLKEICLLDQTFVRSDLFDGTVGGYIADVAKKMGAEIKIKGFVRYGKGEGLEKREDNFADEIAKMVQ
ncbi:MAG: elongation factor Ts [Clostridia bacterium]|nr:elongation factor Ts [Clostridia bacterium]